MMPLVFERRFKEEKNNFRIPTAINSREPVRLWDPQMGYDVRLKEVLKGRYGVGEGW